MGSSSPKEHTVICMEDHNNILDSNGDEEEIGSKKDQKLESAKGEIGEAKEENKRLKFLLARLVNDYQSLQMNFFDILQQDKPKEASKATGIATNNNNHGENEESELVSLSLGISSQGRPATSMDEKENSNRAQEREDEDVDKGLALGLDVRFDPADQTEAANNLSPQSSLDEKGKEEEPSEMWPPSKVLKTTKIGDKSEASYQHAQLKKARVSIRARCDSTTMNDGCQWRKYGQKIAKGNPCPRAYYRCTGSPSCPVRKQVQRCAEDMSILITTYEGIHDHLLPVSATAMASTTSAAASMLQSPSLCPQQGLGNSHMAPIINSSPAHNPNFSKYQISRPQQFYFPNSSFSTLNSHPTITLDLTASPTSSHFSYIPKYPSTNLIFSSGFSPLQSSMPQSPWSSYSTGTGTLAQLRNQGGYVLNTGKLPSLGHHHQPIYMNNHTISQQSLQDPIVATSNKAIKTNPKFQSVLATALTTYVSNNGAGGGGGRLRENHTLGSAALSLKQSGGDLSHTCKENSKGSAPSRYLNMPSSALNSQQGKSISFPPPVSKNAYGSSSNRSNYTSSWSNIGSETT